MWTEPYKAVLVQMCMSGRIRSFKEDHTSGSVLFKIAALEVITSLYCNVILLQLQPYTCTVLCCAVLCCAVLCCAVLCCAVLCCAVLCCAVLCYAMLCNSMLYCVMVGCDIYMLALTRPDAVWAAVSRMTANSNFYFYWINRHIMLL